MRQLASVVGSLGLLLAAFLALDPVAVEVPHADGRCGPPLVRYAAQEHDGDPNAQVIIDRCEEVAADRLVLAGVSVAVGAVAFLALRLVPAATTPSSAAAARPGASAPPRRPTRPPPCRPASRTPSPATPPSAASYASS